MAKIEHIVRSDGIEYYRKKKEQTQTLIRSDIDHSYRSPL